MKKRVVAAVDDLFFASKIRGAAEQAGAEVVFVKTAERLLEEAAHEATDLIILDLQTGRLDPLAAARAIKSEGRQAPVVGFLSHVEVELQRRAREAGVDQVMPRSAFTQRLPEMLRGEE